MRCRRRPRNCAACRRRSRSCTSPPDLAPGLSLGRFDSRAAADKALEQLTQRGVRTARVVTLSRAGDARMLRIERADAALAAQLAALAAR